MRGFFIDSIWAPAPRLAALSAGHRAIRSILVSLGSLRSPRSPKDAAAIAGAAFDRYCVSIHISLAEH